MDLTAFKKLLRSVDLEEIHVEKNIHFLKSGDHNKNLYYVLSGQLAANAKLDEQENKLFDIHKDDFVGLFSFFDYNHEVLSDVKTVTPCTLLKITQESNAQLMESTPSYISCLLYAILQSFRKRMKDLNHARIVQHEQANAIMMQEKMAVVGRMSASMMHELNHLITVILKGSEFLQNEVLGLLEEKMKPKEKTLLKQGLHQSNFMSPSLIRKKTNELKEKNNDIDVNQLKKIIKVWNEDENLNLDDLIRLDKEELGQLEKWQRLGKTVQQFFSASHQMEYIIGSFKSMSHPGKKPEIGYLKESLKKALQFLENDLRNVHVEIINNYEGKINHQILEMTQVWTNLISNSIQAMDGKGQIEITIQEDRIDQNWIKILITDTGPGIPAEMAKTIFLPHITTKKNGTRCGLGLGLTIVTQVIIEHGGRIQAVPKNNQGIIEIFLPKGLES